MNFLIFFIYMDYYNYRKEGEFYYCDLLGINNEDYCKFDIFHVWNKAVSRYCVCIKL